MQRRTSFLAVCTLVLILAGAQRGAAQTGTVRCESKGNGRDQCSIDRGAQVTLAKHLSSTPCRENSNWGVGQGFIWVSNGCRAEFAVTAAAYVPPSQGYGQANPNQVRACRSEADRRLPGYTYDQIRVVPESRQGDVARMRWMAGDNAGMCAVTASGRIISFSMRGDGMGPGNGGDYGRPVTTTISCESKEAGRQECTIPRGARVRLARQISQNPCRLNDTFGTGEGYLWVAKGCRGEFEVTTVAIQPVPVQPVPPVYPGPGGNAGTTTRITCQSVQTIANTTRQCRIPPGATARLVRQVSNVRCQPNVNYGTAEGFIWVKDGCGAEFEVTSSGKSGGNGGGTGLPERVTCESKSGERAECRIRPGGQAVLVRQLSTNPCARNSTWGSGVGVIWVTKGCRGEFEVR